MKCENLSLVQSSQRVFEQEKETNKLYKTQIP